MFSISIAVLTKCFILKTVFRLQTTSKRIHHASDSHNTGIVCVNNRVSILLAARQYYKNYYITFRSDTYFDRKIAT